MIKLGKSKNENLLLKGIFKENKSIDKNIIQNEGEITDFISNKESYIFLGERNKFTIEKLEDSIRKISTSKRDYDVDIKTFINAGIKEEEVLRSFIHINAFVSSKIWSAKTKNQKTYNNIFLLNIEKDLEKLANVFLEETKVIEKVRSFQMMPLNYLNSENYSKEITDWFKDEKDIKVKILKKAEIEKLKMGLLLGVNKGSANEPRVVILEYIGNPSSKEKLGMVGKGIMYDSGGYSLKPSNFMVDMKGDMSGTAIVAGAMKLIAKQKPKVNVVAILPLTDNLINEHAQKPDDVVTSMNGQTVEINNTDAEGRLILADGITYAIRNEKVTKVLDIATLTGAISIALGETYSGYWTTNDNDSINMEYSAKEANELVWRMPFHNDYAKDVTTSPVADLKNTDMTRNAGSSSAAMFLKQFTEDLPFIHIDIAGTAFKNKIAYAPLVRTLANFAGKK